MATPAPAAADSRALPPRHSASQTSQTSQTTLASTPHTQEPDSRTPTIQHEEASLQTVRKHLGLHPRAAATGPYRGAPAWVKLRLVLREPLLEFWGVFIMCFFGLSGTAQAVLSAGDRGAPGGDGFGGFYNVQWGWGIGVMLGIYVAGDSGAYLNPALTLMNCVFRQLPWKRFPAYVLAQFLGGFVAAAVVYANYIPAIDHYEGKGRRTVPPATNATAGIFATYPTTFTPRASQFFHEFSSTAVMAFVVLAFKDENGADLVSVSCGTFFPLALFFLVYGLSSGFGWQTGAAVNFSRDFGPRLLTYCVGYGADVWRSNEYYFWIPIIAPFIGALAGGLAYDMFVYNGDSPVNSPNLGMGYLTRWVRPSVRRRDRDCGGGGGGGEEVV
ncbi:uncharacterized protein K452DRAFT_218019 [Aplosporella prunicola CBS 121167]|uniref:Aquaporin n=1 Tax=Aplosporella prunicola CBS 121167 TaxID=1176127 RepID=A0A6A6BW01_9PEZI|nr:uncharacterized protein K452DRAFT_218019 [Aplosporella prunicola CBS 121167]KAF2147057.1 hypothetical protein K452DRAFT_218019 [Aplosporella prunicola CBS 121167]